MSEKGPTKKPSTVRPPRAIQRARRTRPTGAPAAPQVAARLAARRDVVGHLPRRRRYEAAPPAHDRRCWDRAVAAPAPGTLLLLAPGVLTYARFDQLTAQGVW